MNHPKPTVVEFAAKRRTAHSALRIRRTFFAALPLLRLRRALLTALCLAAVTTAFTACLSASDVTDCAFVQSLGIERGDTFAYRVVLIAAFPKSEGESGAEPENRILSAEARTVFEAIDALNASLPASLDFSRTSLLLLGEGIAKDGSAARALDLSLGSLDIFPNVRMMVSHGPVEATLSGLMSESDPSLSKTMAHLGALCREAGTIIDVRYRAYREMQSVGAYDLLLPYCGAGADAPAGDTAAPEAYPQLGGALLTDGGNETSVAGSAVFDGERMVGVLTARHTQLCGMAQGAFLRGRMQWYHPQFGTVSVLLRRKRPPKVVCGADGVSVTVYLIAEPETPRTLSDPNGSVKEWLGQSLERELAETFSALQGMNADGMGFGRYELMRTGGEGIGSAWKERYRTLSATFSVRLELKERKEGTL